MTQDELWNAMMDAMAGPLEQRRFLRAHATLAQTVDRPDLGLCYEKGKRVNVVMASRFGDVGITDRLNVDRGYDVRVQVVPWDDEDVAEVLVDIEWVEGPGQ